MFNNYTLCTCIPHDDPGSGKWDCAEDWDDDGPRCLVGVEDGQPCALPLTRIDQACRVERACFCNAARKWQCAWFPEG